MDPLIFAAPFDGFRSVSSVDCCERGGIGAVWLHIAPTREELRNESNKSEHDPTSDRSTNYGSGRLIRAFREHWSHLVIAAGLYLAPVGGGTLHSAVAPWSSAEEVTFKADCGR